MKHLKNIILVCALFVAGSLSAQQPEYKLVWQENFRGKQINEDYWSKIPRGNSDWNRKMSSHPSLYKVKKGKMILYGRENKGIIPEDPSSYITGGIYTKDKKTITYGKVAVKARHQEDKGA